MKCLPGVGKSRMRKELRKMNLWEELLKTVCCKLSERWIMGISIWSCIVNQKATFQTNFFVGFVLYFSICDFCSPTTPGVSWSLVVYAPCCVSHPFFFFFFLNPRPCFLRTTLWINFYKAFSNFGPVQANMVKIKVILNEHSVIK